MFLAAMTLVHRPPLESAGAVLSAGLLIFYCDPGLSRERAGLDRHRIAIRERSYVDILTWRWRSLVGLRCS